MAAENEIPAWQRVLVARAQGREADPADVEAARAAAKPSSEGWAATVAAQAAPERRTAPEGPHRFRDALLQRLNRAHGDGPDAA